MPRAAWFTLAGIAAAFAAWFGATSTMADIDLGCAKIAESGAAYECGDRISSVLGMWPLIWLAVLITTPPVVAAVAGRVWVSCVAVAALVAVAIVGLANWTGFWVTLLFALPTRGPGSHRDCAPAGTSPTTGAVVPGRPSSDRTSEGPLHT